MPEDELFKNLKPEIVTDPLELTLNMPTIVASPVPSTAEREPSVPATPANGPWMVSALLTVTFSV